MVLMYIQLDNESGSVLQKNFNAGCKGSIILEFFYRYTYIKGTQLSFVKE